MIRYFPAFRDQGRATGKHTCIVQQSILIANGPAIFRNASGETIYSISRDTILSPFWGNDSCTVCYRPQIIRHPILCTDFHHPIRVTFIVGSLIRTESACLIARVTDIITGNKIHSVFGKQRGEWLRISTRRINGSQIIHLSSVVQNHSFTKRLVINIIRIKDRGTFTRSKWIIGNKLMT